MEGRIKEEFVTKKILEYLQRNGFTIHSYDFPQSGTGYSIRPNKNIINASHKNLSIWIPDIIAFKNNNLCFFENKPLYSSSDIEKIAFIKGSKLYTQKINELLEITGTNTVLYFLGYPSNSKVRNDGIPNHIDGEFEVEILKGEVKPYFNNKLILSLI